MEIQPSALLYLRLEKHILRCDACYKKYMLIAEHMKEQEGKKNV
jgi:hypothetical protein